MAPGPPTSAGFRAGALVVLLSRGQGGCAMRIIDAQIHLWSTGTVVPPHRTTPYLLKEALADMDAAGVHGAVLHPPSWDPGSHDLAIAAAREHPDRFAILGRIPLEEPQMRPL